MNTTAENGNSISNGGSDLGNMDFLRGVESSTCLLLPNTPSPTPLELDFKHPLSEAMSDEPFLSLNGDANVNLQNLDPSAGDSSSSADSNSVVHDPVSAQLINNISMLDYQTLSKNGDLSTGQPEDIKLNGNLSISNRKLPNFVNWNWGLIRKFLLWIVLSALVACLGAIIGMVVTIPKTCNPDLPWYQGKLFYEVFPASFKDSNKDGFGDFKGLMNKLDYINELGVSAIRLNYLFEAEHYPENYENITSMLSVDNRLGGAGQFQELVAAIHERNMSIVLDLPVVSMVNPHSITANFTYPVQFTSDSFVSFDATSSAIMFWSHARYVDGFYLKNLEKYVSDENFGKSLQFWKRIIGHGKILMASEGALRKAEGNALNVLLSRVDLIDVHLNLQQGTSGLKKQIENVINDPLRVLPHHPWIHWNIGNVDSNRVSSFNHINNTLALIALEFVLPGTISLFYGDEIGLGMSEETVDSHHKKVQNLVPMTFQHEENQNHRILPWNSKSTLQPQYHFLDFIKQLSTLRMNTPTLYLQAIYKEDHMLKNAQVRQTDGDLVVLERWYPRRNTCVFVGNLGNHSITTDLSTMFYGGTVVAGTNASLIGTVIYFDKVTFPPNSAIILKLEK